NIPLFSLIFPPFSYLNPFIAQKTINQTHITKSLLFINQSLIKISLFSLKYFLNFTLHKSKENFIIHPSKRATAQCSLKIEMK
ncbi:hypothetical protein Q7419_11610, partial [Glaesserella parasuis]|nr:hypothetical protein [Glaesserella parasuis]MDO9978701.1 hypothetical protein [Glaesserella parasuis]MDP0210303.1 hypothetical protein [Glaesserella parasuis]